MNTVVIHFPDKVLFWLRFLCLCSGILVNMGLSHMGLCVGLVMLWSLCEQAAANPWCKVCVGSALEPAEHTSDALGMCVRHVNDQAISLIWLAYPFAALRIGGRVLWCFGSSLEIPHALFTD